MDTEKKIVVTKRKKVEKYLLSCEDKFMTSSFKINQRIIGSVAIVTILLLVSTLFMFMPLVQASPSPIYGYAEKSDGGSADGAYVEVTSSLGTVSTYVGPKGGWNSGYWQVDVGSPGPDWPDGTSFTVTIRINGTNWQSTASATVSDNITKMETITLTTPSTGVVSPGPGVSPPPSNIKPVADPGGPYTGYVNRSIVFDGTGSTDEDGTITNYSWSFGDGKTGYGITPSHMYTSPGNYTISLTVMDNDGATDTNTTYATISIEPEGEIPVAVITIPALAITNVTVTFLGIDSYDPDGNIVEYTWKINDEIIGYGENSNHVFTAPDTYEVSLTVTDNDGMTDTAVETIVIYQGQAIDIPDGYIIDEDKDGDPDTFYDASTGKITTMEKQADGTFLIDVNDDGIWNYIFNPITNEISPYIVIEEDESFPWWGIVIIIIIIILIIIGFLFYSGIIYIEFEEK